MMGGMGRQFDGSYAEYILVPRAHVFPLDTELEWKILGALPEMLQTVHGSLHIDLEIERAKTLLVGARRQPSDSRPSLSLGQLA